MNIGIDIDNTITETSFIANALAREFNGTLDYHDLNAEQMNEFLTRYLEKIVYDVKIKDGAINVLKKWHQLGYKIIFITARGDEKTDSLVNLKTLYLTSMYFEKMKIPFDELVFFKNSKVDTALKYNLNVFIDDKEEVLDDIKNANIKTLRVTNDKISKHKIVKNWFEIENVIAEMGDK